MTITTSLDIDAPLERVWAALSDLASHVEWMADLASIEFLGEQRSGPGTRMAAISRVGPLRARDLLEVLVWEPPTRIVAAHQGRVTGVGEFTLQQAWPARTAITWREDLQFPWYLGGPLARWLTRPILKRIFRRNLVAFKERVERA